MSESFPRLFSPLTIGHVTLRNRIVMMPHAMSFAGGYGSSVERTIDYFVERAKGGTGMIVMSNFLMPESWKRLASWGGALKTAPLGNLDLANDRSLRPAYAELIGGVHEHGAIFVSQLNASGRQLRSPGTIQFDIPLFAPSPLACPRTGEVPKEMTHADIEEYVATMADAALNMQAAGADGVELFAAQGYLLHEFLSPSTNKRKDAYGGSLENRMRFLTEAIDAIRENVGGSFLLGVRLNTSDFIEGGLTEAGCAEIACILKASGKIDYLNLSGMTSLLYPGWIAGITAPEAQFAELAGGIRAAVPGIPVCVSSRISSPRTGEAILARGQADLIGMARALISDPELPAKARRGAADDIRYCTYSNQSCIVGLDRGRGVGCIHNTAVGKEGQIGIGKMRPATRARKVAVVGGGPGGMAAARVAAERGHSVSLFERASRLGGQNLMTSQIATRRGFGEITRWQEHMLRKSGARIELGVEAGRALLAGGGYGAIILATGSKPRLSGYTSLKPGTDAIPGIERDNVFSVWDAFSRPHGIGYRVAIIEDDPHLAGAAVAEHLAGQGHSVTIVTPHFYAAADLPVHHAPSLYRRLAELRIDVIPHCFVTGIEASKLVCEDRFSGRNWVLEDINSVILAMGNSAETSLINEIAELEAEVIAIGDCLAPRQITHAITEGERAGWML
jgi:2,4-dienoyl-CoA reductase-like NADH-dependent reductase (Old Yellow Enzyme family)